MSINKSELWPHNKEATDIDIDYFKNLPSESILGITPTKEEVKMFPIDLSSGWKPYGPSVDRNMIIHLVSEWIEDEEEAKHFAMSVGKHCYGITKALGHTVYGDFHVYSIAANWKDDIGGFLFANWS